jgi:hypothetical protein
MSMLWRSDEPAPNGGEEREFTGGYRALIPAEEVDVTWECPPGGQDGYHYRAKEVWPRRPEPDSSGYVTDIPAVISGTS